MKKLSIFGLMFCFLLCMPALTADARCYTSAGKAERNFYPPYKCEKSVGTVSARFDYYEKYGGGWTADIYVAQTSDGVAADRLHTSFRVFILKADGTPITHDYCSNGSGFVRLDLPTGSYFVKIVADVCDGYEQYDTFGKHYLLGSFDVYKGEQNSGNITLTEYRDFIE